MSQYVVFDCYQTLIYKNNLENIVRDFSCDILKKKVPLSFIKDAYDVMYDRYKFKHPHFTTPAKRKDFYIEYNKTLFEIIGISISTNQATQLNRYLEKAAWICYPDTLATLKYLKRKKIPMGLLANWTNSLNKVINDVGLLPYFDFAHSSYDIKINKPNSKIFTKALKDVLENFNKIYYIGNDYELDIAPAKNAGLIPILIDRNNRYPDSVDCMQIKTLSDLEKILINN